MSKIFSPQNLRNIPRILLVLLILGLFLSLFNNKVKGDRIELPSDKRAVLEEIQRTEEIVEDRPDYAVAWLRLSILYETVGEFGAASVARETAKKLNPDL